MAANATSTADKRNVKDEILAAGERLFSKKGFKATTLKDVSAACGANTALIGYYFGNKEGLRDAILVQQRERTESGTAFLLAKDPSSFGREDLREFFGLILANIQRDATFFRLVVWSMVDGAELATTMARTLWQPLIDRFKEILRHLGAGRVEEKDLEVRCLMLLGMVHQYAIYHWHSLQHLQTATDRVELLEAYRLRLVDDMLFRILDA
jgi:AcrR family transcriptional regulator